MSWTLNLFKIGRKRDLHEDDLYTTLNNHKSLSIGNKLEKMWKIEMNKANAEKRKPSLLRVLIQIFGAKYMLCGILFAFIEIVLKMIQPLCIGGLLAYFNHNANANTTDINLAYFYASSLVIVNLVICFLHRYAQVEMSHCFMTIRVACSSAILNKALRLSTAALNKTTVGQVVNLLSNDLSRFDVASGFLHSLWIGPLQTVFITYFLWQEVGVSSLFGIVALVVFIPLQGWLGKKTSKFRSNTAPKTDERLRLINEIISGIQVIKMYAWEKPFMRLVRYARKKEIQEIRKATCVRVILQSFIIFHSRFAIFISMLTYVLLGNYIDPQRVFISVSYYNILINTMTVLFPQSFGFLAEILISTKRIQNFLLCDEKDHKPSISSKPENTATDCVKMSTINHDKSENGKIDHASLVISNATAKWIYDQPDNSLNDISLTVKPGRLIAIIGSVGSGKSSLMQAILQELPLSSGSIAVNGIISYASQKPWIFSGSVRQNILFDSTMDEGRYKQVIEVCALNTDLKQFPYGDRTIVGENGSLLSGGQKARINLARAVYKQADIYLLDDPLSAVDAHVGKHLFKKCIEGYLKNKTCILITHQTQYLHKVDQIVLMKNANIVAKGSYQEVQSKNLDCEQCLGSSDKSADTTRESHYKIATATSLDLQSVSLRRESYKSVLSLNGDEKPNGTQKNPIEVVEMRSTGSVPLNVYFSYMAACGSGYQITLLVLTCVIVQVLATFGDWWISHWVNLEINVFRNESVSVDNSTSLADAVINESTGTFLWWSITRSTCIVIYVALIFGMIAAVFVRCVLFVIFFTKSSTNLHQGMFKAIIRTTMNFFSTNPSGQILNRFSDDIGSIDAILPIYIMGFINVSLTFLGSIVVVGLINIYLIIPAFVLGICCYHVVVVYLSTTRSLRRLDRVTRSPIYAHLNTCLQGLTTIRAFKAEALLSREFDNHQDLNSSTCYLHSCSTGAACCILDTINIIYLGFLIFTFIIISNDFYGGTIGLVITQTMRLIIMVQWGIRQMALLENSMTNVERIFEYTDIPLEPALESSTDKKPPKDWPDKGRVQFEKLSLRYSSDTPYVLKNLNFTIQPREKIGIVGRTGAGKSSLIGALFRLALNEGNIIIDDIEIHELGLHDLRSKITIIPQEPILFSGTIRKNLDPINEHPDHVLWKALDDVQLKDVVNNLSDGLNSKVSNGGSNFSVGQRQLLCLARAILKSNNILVLDEATANVDQQTDDLIQNTIKNKFQTCTVLTIAHRLNTVMNSDKILVMDAGLLVEFDHPYVLLQNKNGFLSKMVEETGSNATLLYEIATKSFITQTRKHL